LAAEIGKREAFADPAQEAYLNIMRTAAVLAGPFAKLFAGYRLGESTYNALRIVLGHGERGVPTQIIAQQLISRGPDVTRLVDKLCKLGFVARRTCKNDRRVTYVVATDEGRAVARELDAAVIELHRRQLRHLSRDELADLSRLLVAARRGEA
jgi:DNA-binding MarR family transcriptional regulator